MATGVRGHLGELAVLPVEEELKSEQETVTNLHLTMEEHIAKDHHQKIKLATVRNVHKVRKIVLECTVNISHKKDQEMTKS